ncbi:Ca-activated chloride channel family protein [Labrenzia sp. EL_126]|nr:Ca-activated chloride channel family protein [Labrenzia sp. EL_126]
MTFLTTFAARFTTVFVISTALPAQAALPTPDEMSGVVLAQHGGREFQLPLLKSDYKIEIDGDIAHVELTQTFLNSSSHPVNATYLFPMNQKAAIHAMRVDLDGETLIARIKEKDKAEAAYEKAKAEGKGAALLTQHRPNMFTQDVANLMPGRPVKITIEYVQNVPKIDGAYELLVPMVVGPRYERPGRTSPAKLVSYTKDGEMERLASGDTSVAEAASRTDSVSGWSIDKLPAYPPVFGQNAPKTIDTDRVALDLTLNSPIPISHLESDTHAVTVVGDGSQKSVRFTSGREIDNRDFVLRYELNSEKEIASGLTSHFDVERGGYLSLLIEPPKIPPEAMIGKRELVFVLDTSGSMRDQPMNASKAFMTAAIRSLRPDDHFRIISFSSSASHFSNNSTKATDRNKRLAISHVSSLRAGGGTELNRALNAAFDTRQPSNTTRIVVFLTDGYIGDERNVIQTISDRVGNARIYSFGVGNSVNRFLLDAMAREGRGYARYVPVDGNYREIAADFAAKLKTPLLTDISVDWNGLVVSEPTPVKIPDLFEGGTVRVLARYRQGGKHRIYVNGIVNGHKASLPLDVDLDADGSFATARAAQSEKTVPLIWAREQIFDKNRAYTIGGSSNESLKRQITQLGLTYSLQSRFTSFVAVSEKTVNDVPASAQSKSVPLPQASGVPKSAYPSLNLSGSSAPEPEGMFGLMLVVLALAARFRRAVAKALGRPLSTLKRSHRRSMTADTTRTDTALPRSVRRDGWWLET